MRKKLTGDELILANVLHLRPIRLEIEIGAIIPVVALDAHLDDFGLLEFLGLFITFVRNDFKSKVGAELVPFGIFDVEFTVFGGHMASGWAVAILAAIAHQVRRFLQT